MLRKTTPFAAIAIAGALVLAGCTGQSENTGQADEPAQEEQAQQEAPAFADIRDDIKAELGAASTVSFVGSGPVGEGATGELSGAGTLGEEGGDFEITMTQQPEGGEETTATFVRVDGADFLRADAGIIGAQLGADDETAASMAEALDGRLIRMPEGAAAGADTLFTELRDNVVAGVDDLGDDVSEGEATEVDGTDGFAYTGEGVTLVVRADDPTTVLSLSDDTEGIDLVFSEWNADLGLEAPADEDIVDLDQLAELGGSAG